MTINSYLAGSAQVSLRDAERVDHPAALMAEMARAALTDAGIDDASLVDRVACVEPLAWSYEHLAGTVAERLGYGEFSEVWVPAGGTSPLDLLHKINVEMAEGRVHCAVIAGAETMRTRRRAVKAGETLPWPESYRANNAMRGQGPFASEFERRHGLAMPIQVFPLFENGLRHAAGRSDAEQRRLAADILARNARVAADNPHAWFRDAPDADAIAEATPDNRLIAHPYTKRMNAIMNVDQAAAVVVVSATLAESLDLLPRATAVLGGAGAEDAWFASERADYATSPAMRAAFGAALGRAGLSADQIDAFDLYSCFPSAVQLALGALDTSADDEREFSITGGLAYAGGPGNAYVMHSLATAVQRLRSRPDERLLLTGVGMANTKHAGTVLSSAGAVPDGATGITSYRESHDSGSCPIVEEAAGEARVVSWTISYDREGAAENVIYVLDTPVGRTLANAADPDAGAAWLLASTDPIGQLGEVSRDPTSGRNLFEPASLPPTS